MPERLAWVHVPALGSFMLGLGGDGDTKLEGRTISDRTERLVLPEFAPTKSGKDLREAEFMRKAVSLGLEVAFDIAFWVRSEKEGDYHHFIANFITADWCSRFSFQGKEHVLPQTLSRRWVERRLRDLKPPVSV
ncbi:hypothetical protein PMZ80_007058 [Knufia obscura]|uniref:Uncharacterized protein n=2 Tax=Knufia TaxID=430999 RepID=A0AAN8EKS2_9EURO|nr:hypothetical protein PMZ80_007058 [Knufia obscura]KAK5953067.1 hypothetical protein OHC33_005635 [Knufia fluminis]